MSLIAVVDYGMGNLRSVVKALEHVATNQKIMVTSSEADIRSADRVVFPGQGAARDCMRELEQRQLKSVIMEAAREKPFLGICMGMQVLMSHSEENQGVDCLDMYAGEVRFFGDRFRADQHELKIPQMGWNRVQHATEHPLWHGIENDSRFYFVHSYYVDPQDSRIITGTTQYGIEYVSAIASEHVFAVQFHPEKSADDGLHLLRNFSQWDGN